MHRTDHRTFRVLMVCARFPPYIGGTEAHVSELSARLAARYQWKDRMRVKLSIEAADKVAVRDAYVALAAADALQITAGRAKLPITVIERASAWTLPTIERGAVAIVLEDGLGLTGRRDGASAEWSPSARVSVIASPISWRQLASR